MSCNDTSVLNKTSFVTARPLRLNSLVRFTVWPTAARHARKCYSDADRELFLITYVSTRAV